MLKYYVFPSSDLESVISLRNIPFREKQYLEISIWAPWVLVNIGHKHLILIVHNLQSLGWVSFFIHYFIWFIKLLFSFYCSQMYKQVRYILKTHQILTQKMASSV